MRLPEKFVGRMQALLKEEWPAALASWERQPYQGLRVNTMKISTTEFQKRTPFELEQVPWTEDGFYYSYGARPAKHPYFYAGLYYLQEPSAMAPAACLGVTPGDKVLDLCAAPGGKSTQILVRLCGEGILVSNEINMARARALTWNLERWGAYNAVITNEEPQRLGQRFAGFFDKILVDAPCSGEGMFSRDKRACASWTDYSYTACSKLQNDILEQAAKMLKPGGRMIYSTCTFSPEENEGVVAAFLERHSEFQLCELPDGLGWAEGQPQWVQNFAAKNLQLHKTRRLWPHKVRGEGHFLALLEKLPEKVQSHPQIESMAGIDSSESMNKAQENKRAQGLAEINEKKLAPFAAFLEENLISPIPGPFFVLGDYVYRIPIGLPALNGLKVLRFGWFLGSLKNGRFEPSQALALGLRKENVQRSISFLCTDDEVIRYLKGETLFAEGQKGWTLVCVEEFPLGWAKQTGENLKNNYPPSWRLTEDI